MPEEYRARARRITLMPKQHSDKPTSRTQGLSTVQIINTRDRGCFLSTESIEYAHQEFRIITISCPERYIKQRFTISDKAHRTLIENLYKIIFTKNFHLSSLFLDALSFANSSSLPPARSFRCRRERFLDRELSGKKHK